ncbi:MAG: DUF433 domain-containing protein [Acidobacteriaceae bacterium]|nr:DUF433 domain-containing protein [Acidobacteriaceae bacterium]
MAAVTEIGTLIDRDPAVRGGRPKIAGTGVSVSRIAAWHRMGLTPEEIALEYPHLTLAQVHGALAYYHANREEMRLISPGKKPPPSTPQVNPIWDEPRPALSRRRCDAEVSTVRLESANGRCTDGAECWNDQSRR